jgi:GNAT superfamily N-acetyltransferase
MPLILAPLTKADTLSWTRVRAKAYLGPTHELVHSGPISEASILGVAEDRKRDVGKPNAWQFKVVDTDLVPSEGDPLDNGGKTVAIAIWSAHNVDLPHDDKMRTNGTNEPATKPAEVNATAETSPFVPPEVRFDVLHALLDPLRQAEVDVMGSRPFFMLNSLATLPDHQRRGAAQMLLEWGLKKADDASLPLFLVASQGARPMYERNGFKLRKTIEFDREPWGGEGSDWHYVRPRVTVRGIQS